MKNCYMKRLVAFFVDGSSACTSGEVFGVNDEEEVAMDVMVEMIVIDLYHLLLLPILQKEVSPETERLLVLLQVH
jgi:hypothetical protein